MKKWLIGFGIALIVAAMIGVINMISVPVVQPEEKLTKEQPEKVDEVTIEEYKKIEMGMSYEEVVKIIGFEGTETGMSEMDGVKTVMYSWQNADGSSLNAKFQNNKLNTKEQSGLE